MNIWMKQHICQKYDKLYNEHMLTGQNFTRNPVYDFLVAQCWKEFNIPLTFYTHVKAQKMQHKVIKDQT